jgi:hypothetical protein
MGAVGSATGTGGVLPQAATTKASITNPINTVMFRCMRLLLSQKNNPIADNCSVIGLHYKKLFAYI